MTFAEFLIRSYAYNRAEKNDWYKVREIAWNSLIGFHVDTKKLPKTKERFMSLDGEQEVDLQKQVDAISRAREEYLKQKNGR